ncbi:MAG: M23 family metallopeptidase [Caldilineaceae bacterium]|nr:M23 family metallopeptidase [Caldilineaceae bacterium]
MKTSVGYGIKQIFFAGLVTVICLSVARIALSSYQTSRPVGASEEPINSDYLYGEGSAIHKGIDWSVVDLGDDVYAISSGRVVDFQEGNSNNCAPSGQPSYCDAYGNYILIRHNRTHYDKSSNSIAYVYSLYLHLKQYSVSVDINENVAAGQQIAEIDDTGNSSGHHLHLQIIVNQQSDRVLNNIGSETRSRNPELWINSLTNTATLVGRVSNQSGDPIGNMLIYGLHKNGWGGTLLTYRNGVNPDDYYVENFATTDITPGSYHVEVKDEGGNLIRDFPSQTFVANRTTYVGIDPVFLPDIRKNTNGWTSTITIRNNSPRTAQATVTYFYLPTGAFMAQSVYGIAPNGSVSFEPPGSATDNRAAVIMSSEDVSAAVQQEHSTDGTIDGYAGVENPQTTVYSPILHRNNSGWDSDLFIQNTSNQDIMVTVDFIASVGSNQQKQYNLSPWGHKKIVLDGMSELGARFVGSAKITSNQPLAVVSTQYLNNSQLMATSNSQVIGATLYGPLVQNNNVGYLSGVSILNASGSASTVTARYYSSTGSNCYSDSEYVYGNRSWIEYPVIPIPTPPATSQCPSVVSSQFTSNQSLVANVNQLLNSTQATTYAAISSPSKIVRIPRIRRNDSWNDGFVIRNTESSSATVAITLYNTNGSFNATLSGISISGNGYYVVLGSIPNNFIGSAVISSNRAVAVSVNNLRRVGTGDIISSYPADHE